MTPGAKIMSECPHCGRTANFVHLALHTTAKPYSCAWCKKKSRFDRDTRVSIGGIGAASAFIVQAVFQFERSTSGIALAIGTLAVLAAMHFLFRLLPVDK